MSSRKPHQHGPVSDSVSDYSISDLMHESLRVQPIGDIFQLSKGVHPAPATEFIVPNETSDNDSIDVSNFFVQDIPQICPIGDIFELPEELASTEVVIPDEAIESDSLEDQPIGNPQASTKSFPPIPTLSTASKSVNGDTDIQEVRPVGPIFKLPHGSCPSESKEVVIPDPSCEPDILLIEDDLRNPRQVILTPTSTQLIIKDVVASGTVKSSIPLSPSPLQRLSNVPVGSSLTHVPIVNPLTSAAPRASSALTAIFPVASCAVVSTPPKSSIAPSASTASLASTASTAPLASTALTSIASRASNAPATTTSGPVLIFPKPCYTPVTSVKSTPSCTPMVSVVLVKSVGALSAPRATYSQTLSSVLRPRSALATSASTALRPSNTQTMSTVQRSGYTPITSWSTVQGPSNTQTLRPGYTPITSWSTVQGPNNTQTLRPGYAPVMSAWIAPALTSPVPTGTPIPTNTKPLLTIQRPCFTPVTSVTTTVPASQPNIFPKPVMNIQNTPQSRATIVKLSASINGAQVSSNSQNVPQNIDAWKDITGPHKVLLHPTTGHVIATMVMVPPLCSSGTGIGQGTGNAPRIVNAPSTGNAPGIANSMGTLNTSSTGNALSQRTPIVFPVPPATSKVATNLQDRSLLWSKISVNITGGIENRPACIFMLKVVSPLLAKSDVAIDQKMNLYVHLETNFYTSEPIKWWYCTGAYSDLEKLICVCGRNCFNFATSSDTPDGYVMKCRQSLVCKYSVPVPRLKFFKPFAMPLDKLHRLIFHWAVQSDNIETIQDADVSFDVVKFVWQKLRAICSDRINKSASLMGGPNEILELCLAKMGPFYIICLMNARTKVTRMQTVFLNGSIGTPNIYLVLKTLKPLLLPYSIILTTDPLLCHNMVNSSHKFIYGTEVPFEQKHSIHKVIVYLRETLKATFGDLNFSGLSEKIVQEFLDEIQWRDRYGQGPAAAFWNIISAIASSDGKSVNIPIDQRDLVAQYSMNKKLIETVSQQPTPPRIASLCEQVVTQEPVAVVTIGPQSTIGDAERQQAPATVNFGMPIILNCYSMSENTIEEPPELVIASTKAQLPESATDAQPPESATEVQPPESATDAQPPESATASTDAYPRDAQHPESGTSSTKADPVTTHPKVAQPPESSTPSTEVHPKDALPPKLATASRETLPQFLESAKDPKEAQTNIKLVTEIHGDINTTEMSSIDYSVSHKKLTLSRHFYGRRFYKPQQVTPKTATEPIKFQCLVCFQEISNNIAVMKHVAAHLDNACQFVINADLIQCDYCFKVIESLECMEEHIKTVHHFASEMYCKICGLEFETEKYLLCHMLKCHVHYEMPYVCKVCYFRTSFYLEVLEHFQKAHKDTTNLICHFCLKTLRAVSTEKGNFYTFSLFYNHMCNHCGKANSHNCGTCLLSFRHESELRFHMRDHTSMSAFKDVVPYYEKLPEKEIYFDPGDGELILLLKEMIMKGTKEKNKSLDGFNRKVLKKNEPVGVHGRNMKADQKPSRTKRKNRDLYLPPCKKPGKTGPFTPMDLSELVSQDLSTLIWDEPEADLKCLECLKFVLTNHFKNVLCCKECSYSTCCSNAMLSHNQRDHSAKAKLRKRRGKYQSSALTFLPNPMTCYCGFNSFNGERLATHLTTCKSLEQAVYHKFPDSSKERRSESRTTAAIVQAELQNTLKTNARITQTEESSFDPFDQSSNKIVQSSTYKHSNTSMHGQSLTALSSCKSMQLVLERCSTELVPSLTKTIYQVDHSSRVVEVPQETLNISSLPNETESRKQIELLNAFNPLSRFSDLIKNFECASKSVTNNSGSNSFEIEEDGSDTIPFHSELSDASNLTGIPSSLTMTMKVDTL